MRDAWERFYENQPRPWAGVVELPALKPGTRVLELGCGGGRILAPLLERGRRLEVVGADLSRRSLASLPGDSAGALVQADAVNLPFRDASFDVVFCRHVLGHLTEEGRGAAACEILRVLKKGGTALFEGFAAGDARSGKGRQVEKDTYVRGDGIAHHYFQPGEIRGLFSGASVVNVRQAEWTERAGRTRMKRAVVRAEVRR
jgi:SAM-dependent methyltransferase